MKNILKKCLEELAKETPKLDYIRGMLEVLVEQEPEPVGTPLMFTPPPAKPIPATVNTSVNPHGLPTDDPGMDILSGRTIKNA